MESVFNRPGMIGGLVMRPSRMRRDLQSFSEADP
jgi:hypothetical protein